MLLTEESSEFLDAIRFIRGADDIDDTVWVAQQIREVDGYRLIRSNSSEYDQWRAMWLHTKPAVKVKHA